MLRISNRYLDLQFDKTENSFRIENRSNGRIYRTEPQRDYRVTNASVTNGTGFEITQEYGGEYGGITIATGVELEEGRIRFVMKAQDDAVLKRGIAFPGAISGGESRQFFAIPYAEGIYVPADRECEFGEFEMWGHKSTMPFVGMTDSKTGIMVTSGTPADTSVAFVRNKASDTGNYLMQLVHYPSKGRFGYDRVFRIDVIGSDGYNEMADKFREYLEELQKSGKAAGPGVPVKLKEKAELSGNVKKLIGAVDFWLGPLNMKTEEMIDSLKENGVKKALVNFQYGWNVYEEEKRPRAVRYAEASGYLASRYDNYTDVFEPGVRSLSTRFRTEDLRDRTIVKESGSYQEGYASLYKGQMVQSYRLNTGMTAGDIDAYLKPDLAENEYNGRFVDVMVSCRLYEDYSGKHPMTRSQDLANRYRLLKKISAEYGMVTGTEETAWWAVPVTHYSEGTLTIAAPEGAGDDWSTPVESPGKLFLNYTVNPSVRIPLKSLVYHDCHVSGWYTGDGVSKVMSYWNTKEMLTSLYGAMLLVFPGSPEMWEENRDRYLRSMWITSWIFENTGYEKMDRHDFLTGDRLVQRTQFSNGIMVIANFSGRGFRYGVTIVPAGEFLVIKGRSAYTPDQIARMARQ